MNQRDPFHEGERRVQEMLDEVVEARGNGRMISDEILRGALTYVEQQTLAVFASRDEAGDPRATIVTGPPGFLRARDTRTVEVDLTASPIPSEDPLLADFARDPEAGLLVIDLATRRRIRINGRMRRTDDRHFRIDVAQSYPNCPKYIQTRTPGPANPADSEARQTHVARFSDDLPRSSGGSVLEDRQRAWIRAADTFFVASAHPERGVDASHRGGEPGFVRLLDERTLRIPDYEGNHMYNTLGNFVVLPRAGLAFPDFASDRVLQLGGSATLRFGENDPTGETGGTNRYWNFTVERWREASVDLAAVRRIAERSRFNPRPAEPVS